MKFHFLGDRTERAFSRGQRHLERWSFDEALRAFDSAIESDPAYPHLYMYRGLALAELGRLEDAVNALNRAAQLQSTNFVFPMYLGCIHLDEGQAAAAAEAFGKAAALAPTNTLVSSYRLLADYAVGDERALQRLGSVLVQTSDSFKARLLLALPGWSQPDSGERATTAFPETKVRTRGSPGKIRRWIDEWEMGRFRRRVDRLFAQKRYEAVLDLLRDGQTPADLETLAESARTEALKELSVQIERLGTKDDKQRRSLLIRRASVRPDDRARYRDLEQWVESFRHADRPQRARPVAADVFAEMADIDRRLGRHEVAIRMCEQSRVQGASGEVDWIEAQARAVTGPNRHARRLLERFARSRSLSFDARVKDRIDRRLVSAQN